MRDARGSSAPSASWAPRTRPSCCRPKSRCVPAAASLLRAPSCPRLSPHRSRARAHTHTHSYSSLALITLVSLSVCHSPANLQTRKIGQQISTAAAKRQKVDQKIKNSPAELGLFARPAEQCLPCERVFDPESGEHDMFLCAEDGCGCRFPNAESSRKHFVNAGGAHREWQNAGGSFQQRVERSMTPDEPHCLLCPVRPASHRHCWARDELRIRPALPPHSFSARVIRSPAVQHSPLILAAIAVLHSKTIARLPAAARTPAGCRVPTRRTTMCRKSTRTASSCAATAGAKRSSRRRKSWTTTWSCAVARTACAPPAPRRPTPGTTPARSAVSRVRSGSRRPPVPLLLFEQILIATAHPPAALL